MVATDIVGRGDVPEGMKSEVDYTAEGLRWFGVSFASAMGVSLLLLPSLMKGVSTPTSQMMVWFPLITSGLTTMLVLAKDIAFLFWARRKLYSEFRERAVQAVAPIRAARPPPLSPAGTPPVIAPT